MKISLLLFLFATLIVNTAFSKEIDLFILAGQSNAQGWMGNAASYPKDPDELDQTIPFFWNAPNPQFSSSKGQWTTLQPQGGRFKNGHFGPEVTFARSLKKAGYHPAIFKYSLGSTSIARNWKGPGDGVMYDQMVAELRNALTLLRKDGTKVTVRGFIWIQGESDAQTPKMANAYKENLKKLIVDLRNQVLKQPKLPIILGVDEQHAWVKKHPQVVRAQQELAKEDAHIVFTSMLGLEKADSTHLTPKGLEKHGNQLYSAYKKLTQYKEH